MQTIALIPLQNDIFLTLIPTNERGRLQLKIPSLKHRLNESGISLVEVVAATVLLTFILLSFFTLIINTAKTTKTSEGIVDYTYLAQTEMENAYELSSTSTSKDLAIIKKSIPSLGYTYHAEKDGYSIFKKPIVADNVYVLLKIKKHDPLNYDNLTNFIIEVYGNDRDVLKAKMETILMWGE